MHMETLVPYIVYRTSFAACTVYYMVIMHKLAKYTLQTMIEQWYYSGGLHIVVVLVGTLLKKKWLTDIHTSYVYV